LSISAPM